MIASYHTHTYRCRHAFGTEEEYIEKAIAEGLEILGFSDHAPMPYKNGYVSNYKMTPQEAGEYFEFLIALREKYKDKIDIKIGFETEYYPSLWESSLAFWRKFPIDFLILGQHFVPEERGEGCVHTLMATENKDVVICYVDQIIVGMRSGVISYVAHPDMINYVGEDTEFFINLDNVKEYKKKYLISPKKVAKGAISAVQKNKAIYSPTFSMKLLRIAAKVLPTRLLLKFSK